MEMDYTEILDFGDEPVTDVESKLKILKFSYSWADKVEEEERLKRKETNSQPEAGLFLEDYLKTFDTMYEQVPSKGTYSEKRRNIKSSYSRDNVKLRNDPVDLARYNRNNPSTTRGQQYTKPRFRNRRYYDTRDPQFGKYPRKLSDDTPPFRYRKANAFPSKDETFPSRKKEDNCSVKNGLINLHYTHLKSSKNIDDNNNDLGIISSNIKKHNGPVNGNKDDNSKTDIPSVNPGTTENSPREEVAQVLKNLIDDVIRVTGNHYDRRKEDVGRDMEGMKKSLKDHHGSDTGNKENSPKVDASLCRKNTDNSFNQDKVHFIEKESDIQRDGTLHDVKNIPEASSAIQDCSNVTGNKDVHLQNTDSVSHVTDSTENCFIRKTQKPVCIYDERTGMEIGENPAIQVQYLPCDSKENQNASIQPTRSEDIYSQSSGRDTEKQEIIKDETFPSKNQEDSCSVENGLINPKYTHLKSFKNTDDNNNDLGIISSNINKHNGPVNGNKDDNSKTDIPSVNPGTTENSPREEVAQVLKNLIDDVIRITGNHDNKPKEDVGRDMEIMKNFLKDQPDSDTVKENSPKVDVSLCRKDTENSFNQDKVSFIDKEADIQRDGTLHDVKNIPEASSAIQDCSNVTGNKDVHPQNTHSVSHVIDSTENCFIRKTQKPVYIYDERSGLEIVEVHAQYLLCDSNKDQNTSIQPTHSADMYPQSSGSDTEKQEIIKISNEEEKTCLVDLTQAASVAPLKTHISQRNGLVVMDSEICLLSTEIIYPEEFQHKNPNLKDSESIADDEDFTEHTASVSNKRSPFWRVFLCGSCCSSVNKKENPIHREKIGILNRIRKFFRRN
ncbi:putative uncharacterized protein DDB_G0282133 [Saccostrea echinata]|uniref:putative uncharacterized protein DDB_G0282133 n=1 Tax=Saccostrea echinata TaxID=191078 RepID=UPI002A831E61|nr:putative uncharacterized protein DDB_G0282133 [Saccostrea echinata]